MSICNWQTAIQATPSPTHPRPGTLAFTRSRGDLEGPTRRVTPAYGDHPSHTTGLRLQWQFRCPVQPPGSSDLLPARQLLKARQHVIIRSNAKCHTATCRSTPGHVRLPGFDSAGRPGPAGRYWHDLAVVPGLRTLLISRDAAVATHHLSDLKGASRNEPGAGLNELLKSSIIDLARRRHGTSRAG